MGDIEFPALLDTGAIDVAFTRATAQMVELNRFPLSTKIDDYGLKPSRIVPLTLGDLTLSAQTVVNQWHGDNIVWAWHFIQNGYGLTFNPNSLEIYGL